jgi:MYXO-CTERM domain-containing protein
MITLSTHAWGSFAFAGLLLTLARPAAAQSCEADADCGAGYVCHTETYEGCSVGPCRPGRTCPPPVCQTYESKYCISAPCSTDADCPSSMVCYAPTYQECSGGGMGGAPACDADAGVCNSPKEIDGGTFECHDVTGDATCTPRYQLPCHVAADCGAGFACEEQRYTVCSTTGGSSGMGGAGGKENPGVMTPPGSAGGSAALDAGAVEVDGGDYSYECHEEASGSFYCRLLELPCDSDADCGEGLECQRNPYDYDCGGTAADAGTATGVGGTPATMAAAGSMVVDGGVRGCVDDGAPAQVCAPHNYYSGGYPGMGGGSAGSGSGNSGTGGASAADGGVQGPGGGSNEGSAGNTTGGDSDSSGHGHDHHPAHHHHNAGHLPRLGCSVGGESGSQLASWFGLIGLVAFGLRRRARRG